MPQFFTTWVLPTLEALSYTAVVVGLWIGVLHHRAGVRQTRIRSTMEHWEKINQALRKDKEYIKNKYHTVLTHTDAVTIFKTKRVSPSSPEPDIVILNRVINTFEQFALGVRMGAYDFTTVRYLCRSILVTNYDRYQKYLEYYSQQKARPVWEEFTALVEKLRREHP